MSTFVEFSVRVGVVDLHYTLDVEIRQPESDAPIRPFPGVPPPTLDINKKALDAAADQDDAAGYGGVLSDALFGSLEMRQAFDRALTLARTLATSLRVRLEIDPGAADLHALRWELLQEPDRAGPAAPPRGMLATRDDVVFSRFVPSGDFRRVPLRPRSELRALVAVANGSDLAGSWHLAPIDVGAEIASARTGLGDIESTTIGDAAPSTVGAITAELRGGYDILYLVCHGGRRKADGEPFLLLQDENGAAAAVLGADLVACVAELVRPPRLIVLASCQSAGRGSDGAGDATALTALGPRLADAGIGAVVAMQGTITQETVAGFMPVFFKGIAGDGVIDRAMAAARSAVRGRDDWWMPVLFMRLQSGAMWWYSAGFREGFQRWPALIAAIANAKCTPILGPGMTDHIIGNRRDIAQRIAEANGFPFARHAREDLPQVAQFLKMKQHAAPVVPSLVLKHLCCELVQRHGHWIPDALKLPQLDNLADDALADLYERVVEAVWRRAAEQEDQQRRREPHSVLASLPFPLYVTTNPEQLLQKAVADATFDGVKRTPVSEVARWKEELAVLPSAFDARPADPVAVGAAGTESRPHGRGGDFGPTRDRPLVYQLFGSWTTPESLVITEDDYFDFLIGYTENKDLIPKRVPAALANTSLLFLGFQLDDWDFRVLFRILASQEGGGRRVGYPHVAVQIDPDEGRVMNPDQVRQLMNEWFGQANVSIFWGTVQDFTAELHAHWA
jgi:hypothetical protein